MAVSIRVPTAPGDAPELKGQIIRFNHGIQTVQTDSKEHPMLHFMGFTTILDGQKRNRRTGMPLAAQVGDRVRCKYKFVPERMGGFWFGRKV